MKAIYTLLILFIPFFGFGQDDSIPFITIMFLVSLIAVYFLPSLIGINKRNKLSLFVLNLFLGWTLVGWVVALVWAFKKEDKIQILKKSDYKISDEIIKLNELKEKGLLNDEEFNEQKKKILAK